MQQFIFVRDCTILYSTLTRILSVLFFISAYLVLSCIDFLFQASKSQKSDAQKEKERKRREHAQKILQKHGGERKRLKTGPETTSAFQALFKQRAQGFEISFKFKNAPPRPPVGPSFIGTDLDEKLREISQYKPLNAVEVSYRYKLHNEPDLGVPLAPSAMNPAFYEDSKSSEEVPLHPDDLKLLEWDGSMADTAAEELKKNRENARASARLALIGKSPATLLFNKTNSPATNTSSTKKPFSRVLDEKMQSWMQKTTYITNDYSRKVHDFKSLAKTKQELAQDLEIRQQKIMQRRSGPAVSKTFEDCKRSVHQHPSKRGIKPVAEMDLLPNVEQWGNAYTHLVMDKPSGDDISFLDKAFVANVEKRDANARMTCQLFVPSEDNLDQYQAMQQYELDVVPLKDEDAPHVNFCMWVNPETKSASYTPISSRVQLSNGRPLRKKNYKMNVTRRPMTEEDKAEVYERVSEVDLDFEEKSNESNDNGTASGRSTDKVINDDSDGSDHDQ